MEHFYNNFRVADNPAYCYSVEDIKDYRPPDIYEEVSQSLTGKALSRAQSLGQVVPK